MTLNLPDTLYISRHVLPVVASNAFCWCQSHTLKQGGQTTLSLWVWSHPLGEKNCMNGQSSIILGYAILIYFMDYNLVYNSNTFQKEVILF